MAVPRVAVYAGSGASHSWTWFADVFDRERYDAVTFITEHDIAGGTLCNHDVLMLSGGDTFAIAAALGHAGAAALEQFVRNGGTYIGACAGAYLPLTSSLAPLHLFNFVRAKISNLARCAPHVRQQPEKSCTAYGCRYVLHPVRGALRLQLHAQDGATRDRCIMAPLYGGPAILPSEDVAVLATYAGFTEETEFLMDTTVAQSLFLGTAAAVRKRLGSGYLYLFGPHCEHPSYPEANRLLLDIIRHARSSGRYSMTLQDAASSSDPVHAQHAYRAFLSALSSGRIMASGLERAAYRWRIGTKLYDPERILVLFDALFSRAQFLHKTGCSRCISAEDSSRWQASATTIIAHLHTIRERGDGDATQAAAQALIDELRVLAAEVLNAYFLSMHKGMVPKNGRRSCTTTISTFRRPRRSTPCRL
ncbi:MAG: BPL-N domain-containing protein [Desulfobacterota bacterium]|nr:BPL-N domain-containing protein [Thermodesulfobacteriota bacterium]